MIRIRIIETAAIAALLAVVITIAAHWIRVVPMFQASDEDLHLDYALSIYSAGRLLWTLEKPVAELTTSKNVAPVANPITYHLMVRSAADRIRFETQEKAPPGYGTSEYFARVNATMPRDMTQLRNPWLVTEYPFLYYTSLAVWLRLISVFRSDVVTLFFSARAFSVFLLAISLVLSYLYFREIGTTRVHSFALIAIVGLLPFTMWVACAVQADNLSFTMVTLASYLAVRARIARDPSTRTRRLLFLGLALAGLFVTKYHFYLCLMMPVMAMLIAEIAARPVEERRWARSWALLFVPTFLVAALQWSIHRGDKFNWLERTTLDQRLSVMHSLGWPRYFATRVPAAIYNFFGGGSSFTGLWGRFGWNEIPLRIGSDSTGAVVRVMLLAGTWLVIALTLTRLAKVVSRLVVVKRQRGVLTAARIAFANPLANSYFLFVLMLFFLYLYMDNFIKAQARQWFPYTCILFWFWTQCAPRAFKLQRTRRVFAAAVAVALFVYAIVASYYAFPTLRARFY